MYLVSSINVGVNETNLNWWSFFVRSSGVDNTGEIIGFMLVDWSESNGCVTTFQLSPSEIDT